MESDEIMAAAPEPPSPAAPDPDEPAPDLELLLISSSSLQDKFFFLLHKIMFTQADMIL